MSEVTVRVLCSSTVMTGGSSGCQQGGCLTCSDYNGCLSCKPRFFMHLERIGMKQIGVCMTSCPPGFYGTRSPERNTCTSELELFLHQNDDGTSVNMFFTSTDILFRGSHIGKVLRHSASAEKYTNIFKTFVKISSLQERFFKSNTLKLNFNLEIKSSHNLS